MNQAIYVFLDFDGVLNNSLSWDFSRKPEHGNKFLDHRAVKAFSKFMEKTPNALLVISSVWRLHYNSEDLDRILESFGYTGPKISYYTPKAYCRDRRTTRFVEIRDFIVEHGVQEFVIFDDMDIRREIASQNTFVITQDRFIFVNNEVGLTYSDLDAAADVVTTEWTKPVHLF